MKMASVADTALNYHSLTHSRYTKLAQLVSHTKHTIHKVTQDNVGYK